MPELPKAYNPAEVEPGVYQRWETSGYFNPDNLPGRRGKPFVISMPPPNITGELHLGHALGMTIEDTLIRFERMRGRRALWIPGTDHAAIATQVVVEREIRKEGFDRVSLGREKFLERVWAWKNTYGAKIVDQVKRLGASADWSRERFTMDAGLTKAVQTAFLRLHRDGLLYRGERIINWCSDCQTAISDLEVDHAPTPGSLWFLRYPLTDDSGSILVATTRPETMLGDTAVAVHPDDQRYRELVGKKVRLPIVNREIPIIADSRIEREFGTGAVKVTPAHDPLDWDLGQAHHLPVIAVIDRTGRMSSEAGPEFAGKPIAEARRLVVERFESLGLLERVEDYVHAVATCSRSQTVIEPLLSLQWFIRTKPLAVAAMKAVRAGRVKIVPARYEKVYFQWLENIRDWNISRQIWWGHRLPVWYRTVGETEETRVAIESPGPEWRQDEDTLDTWFSSGLWTFSTLGWPKRTRDLKTFHPTDVMETGWDILFFWVARMMMLSLYLLDEVPFRTIYLHGLILDKDGKKMSKSKGTGIDPVPTQEKYGTDALRMSLLVGNAPGQDFRMYEEKIAGYRNFANKLWNISRFALSQPVGSLKPIPVSVADHWVMARLSAVTTGVTNDLAAYSLSTAGQTLYDFVWHDVADWYLEWSKFAPNPGVLRHVIMTSLKLLHPIMPFITERLWAEFAPDTLLMVTAWPKPRSEKSGASAIEPFVHHQAVITKLRALRTHAEPGDATGEVVASAEDVQAWQTLSRVQLRAVDRLAVGSSCLPITFHGTTFLFPAPVVRRFDGWREKERGRLRAYAATITGKLNSESFVSHAPPSVIDLERQKLAQAQADLQAID